MITYCQYLADEGREFVIVETTDHPSECDGTEDVDLEIVFNLDGWRGRTLAATFVRIVADMGLITLTPTDERALDLDEDGSEWTFDVDGEELHVSDWVTSVANDAEEALCKAGYYVEWNDGVVVYGPVTGSR